MRASIAILALLIGIFVGQAVSAEVPPRQHADVIEAGGAAHALMASAATAHGDMDCAGCDQAEPNVHCLGASSGCMLALVGLPHSARAERPTARSAKASATPADRTLGGLALGVDTPPPRSTT